MISWASCNRYTNLLLDFNYFWDYWYIHQIGIVLWSTCTGCPKESRLGFNFIALAIGKHMTPNQLDVKIYIHMHILNTKTSLCDPRKLRYWTQNFQFPNLKSWFISQYWKRIVAFRINFSLFDINQANIGWGGPHNGSDHPTHPSKPCLDFVAILIHSTLQIFQASTDSCYLITKNKRIS